MQLREETRNAIVTIDGAIVATEHVRQYSWAPTNESKPVAHRDQECLLRPVVLACGLWNSKEKAATEAEKFFW
jgi:hypothetical protein